MNDSNEFYQISRHLYFYRNQAANILKSRTYTVGKTLKTAIKQPAVFSKKAAVMAVSNPKRLLSIVTGKRAIQNNKKVQDELTIEYNSWLKTKKLSNEDIVRQQVESKKFKKKPLVSLITPVFNPPVDAHIKLIESVLEQTYCNFELLLYNFGNKPEIEKLLDEYAAKDNRIIVKHNMPNKGIGANSNACLKDASGEFVGLLDHDDALTVNALYECVKALNKTDTDFIYTDKDKITEDDLRFDPQFKPDWSPEMALGGNYMTHFNLMRTEIVKELGGWDPETDGAQDWDIFLRIIEKTTKPVLHVPEIVYHWRTVATSTASGSGAKPYVYAAQKKTVLKHLHKLGVKNGKPKHDINGQQNIHWQQSIQPSLLIHSIYHDTGNILNILESDEGHSDKRFVFIPEKRLEDKERKSIQDQPNVKIIEYKIGDFVGSLQSAKNEMSNRIIYIVDSIKEVNNVADEEHWSTQLSGWLELPNVSIAGGGLYSESGYIVDIGSFYDKSSARFSKYYFGAGQRSGYNGHAQWIRNHTLVSERLFCFDKKLLTNLKSLLEIRDDEFAKALAVICISNKQRCVYDPLVYGVDGVTYELRLQSSDTLKNYIEDSTELQKTGDPYYNTHLNNSYSDPKPRMSGKIETDVDFLRSFEVAR